MTSNHQRALGRFARACEGGDAEGCVELGRATEKGIGTVADPAGAFDVYRKAVLLLTERCERREQRACGSLGVLLREGSGIVQDESRGLALQRDACEAGEGALCVAWMSRGRNLVLTGSAERALAVLVRSCGQGEGSACFMLGRMGPAPLAVAGIEAPTGDPFEQGCRAGHGASCNAAGLRRFPPDEQGRALLERGCELGDAPGCYHLGVALELAGKWQDTGRAVTLYQRGCDWRHGASCTRLGTLASTGEGTGIDLERATGAYARGCELGHGQSCHELGALLEDGVRVAADAARGRALVERACKQGEQAACSRMGRRLTTDVADAAAAARGAELLESACQAGHARACLDLADMARHGRGVPREAARATALARRAASVAVGACERALGFCHSGAEAVVVRSWQRWAGAPAYALTEYPACDMRLEQQCLDAVDAQALRCALEGRACFTAARLLRRLATVGLGAGAEVAAHLEKAGAEAARRDCALDPGRCGEPGGDEDPR